MICRRSAPLFAALLLAATLAPGRADGPAPAPADPLAAIEQAIEARRKELGVPGAAIAIVRNDRVIFSKGFGLRDVERGLPVTPDTLFAIGSSTKAFTALAVVMEAEAGRLSLDDSPRRLLPYFALRDPEAAEKITVRDLLDHRSGLDRTDLLWYTGVLSREEVIRAAGQARPTAKLGERWQYQNVMYAAAGEIAARAAGTSYEALIAERIFRPLGMTHSNLSVPETVAWRDFAVGYSVDPATREPRRLPMRPLPAVAPAGAINSNVRDMAQWVRLMLAGGQIDGRRLVSEAGFAELTKPHMTIAGKNAYGLGWFLREWRGERVVEHGGNIDGFSAQVALLPGRKVGFVLLTNVSASPLPQFAMETVWTHLAGLPDEAPAPAASPVTASVPSEQEAGSYDLGGGAAAEVAVKDGQLTLTVPGQPPYPLVPLGGRRYKLGPPAPDGFFATFRPGKDDPEATELYLEQPHGNFALPRRKAAAAEGLPSVEELSAKVIEAMGGEDALRRRRSMRMAFTLEFEHQGIVGEGVRYARAPGASAMLVTLRAGGRRIGTMREYFDGASGGEEASFSAPSPKTGKALEDARIASDLHEPLNWGTLYRTVTVKGKAKVGDEEAYVVEKAPEKGNPVTDFYSTATYRLLRRDSLVQGPGGMTLPTSETYLDYREVAGVPVPFTVVRNSPGVGEATMRVTDLRFNVRVPESAFRPARR